MNILNDESSRLDDDDDVDENMYKIPKYDPNHLLSEESKGILNLYNGKVRKQEICVVPNNIVFEPKGPEDKKPPDINKLREKKRLKMLQKKEKIIENPYNPNKEYRHYNLIINSETSNISNNNKNKKLLMNNKN